MNVKKTQRNLQVANMERLNRGDLMEKSAKDLLSDPTDQGDVKNKNIKDEKSKNIAKAEKELVLPTRGPDVKCDVTPFKLEITELKTDDPSTDLDSGVADYRKRVKDRYTFLRLKNDPKNVEVNESPMIVEINEFQMQSQKEPVKKKPIKKLNQNKQLRKTQAINKAVSVMKIKPDTHIDKKDLIFVKETKNEKLAKITGTRKPIIKTITKHDTVFKDVKMFVDKTQPTPLKIKIPIKEDKMDGSSLFIPKFNATSAQKTETPVPKRKEFSVRKKSVVKNKTKHATQAMDSQTDITVKLVPESTNRYTQPYYEAWVNKTLTATSKLKGKAIKKLYEVPEMCERFGEQHAGTIKVRQKITKERRL